MSGNPSVTLTQVDGYRFLVDFGPGVAELAIDEPPPLGSGGTPTPGRLLLAGVANCLLFALHTALGRAGADAGRITATATARPERNAEGRLRIAGITVAIRLGKPAAAMGRLDEVLGRFTQFSTISQSVRQGIPLEIVVEDADGTRLGA